MEISHFNSNKEAIQDEYAKQSLSPCSSDAEDIFGDPHVLPRVGEEYQAEIPPLIPECDRLQLINRPRSSKVIVDTHGSVLLGLPIPLMWSSSEDKSTNGTVESNSDESQITSKNEYGELEGEPMDALSGYGKDIGVHSNLQKTAGGNKMEVDLGLPQESETKMDQVKRGYCLLPGSSGKSWTDIEHDSFILGLYIFGKNLLLVKRFVESKELGDVLSYYYGKFYGSDGYRRWSVSWKQRSRRNVLGQKIFTGWRQQELLSRLFSRVSQECQNMLLEVSRILAEGKVSFVEYIFTLKGAVGLNMLIEVVGIGKGKQDLTSTAMEPMKSNHVLSVHPEIPIGKACSSLTSAEIIKFLTGDFRLSKARSSDLFWEAVWPRLLANGWHSEQPKNHGTSASRHPLVFVIPGVKKFSRSRHVKGNHYFDSVSDVLNKVASEPGLIKLEIEAAEGSPHKEENGWDPPLKLDQNALSNKQHRRYLQPHISNCDQDLQKFTIVDTSLSDGADRPKVRELRTLPLEITSVSTFSLSSEIEEDTSEESLEEANKTNTSNPAEDVTEGRTFADSSDCVNSLLNASMTNALDPTIAAVENHEYQSTSLANDNQPRKSMDHQFIQNINSGHSKYLVPLTKQQGFTACDNGESSCNTKYVSTNRKLNEDGSHCTSNSPDTCEDMVFQVGPPQNLSSASSLAKGSPDGGNEGIDCDSCPGRDVSPEKPQCPKLIDLNIPHVSPDFAADEPIMTDIVPNNESSCVNESSFLSERSQQPEPLKVSDATGPPGQQPSMSSRRQSTRNRPLTTKALEAIELGFFNIKKKRKGADTLESNPTSGSSRRVRGRTGVKATPNDGVGNDVVGSRTVEVFDGFHNNTDMVGESQV